MLPRKHMVVSCVAKCPPHAEHAQLRGPLLGQRVRMWGGGTLCEGVSLPQRNRQVPALSRQQHSYSLGRVRKTRNICYPR